MCFQASSPHDVKQSKSSKEISWTQRWPIAWLLTNEPVLPRTCKILTRCSSGSQASHVCGEISPPRGSGGSQRGLSHLLRESSSFDDVGWIKTHRSQLRIIKQQKKTNHLLKDDQQVWTWSWKPNTDRLELAADSTTDPRLNVTISAWPTEQKQQRISARACVFTPEHVCSAIAHVDKNS